MAGLVVSMSAAVVGFGAIPASMFATVAPWMKLGYAGTLAPQGFREPNHPSALHARPRVGVHAASRLPFVEPTVQQPHVLVAVHAQRHRDLGGE